MVKTVLEGENTRITVTLGRNNEPKLEIENMKKNPDKVSFGQIFDGRNRLEIASYDKTYHSEGFIFLNGERVMIDKFQWRKLMGSLIKMGNFFKVMNHKNKKVLTERLQKGAK